MKGNNIGLKKQGFTLIELLVVIVIIGILSAIGVATFQGFFAKARDAERKSSIDQAHKIILAAQVSSDTPDYDDLNSDTVADTQADVNAVMTAAGYTMEAAVNGHNYVYIGKDTDYVIGVCLEDNGTLYARASTTTALAEVSCVSNVPTLTGSPTVFDNTPAAPITITWN